MNKIVSSFTAAGLAAFMGLSSFGSALAAPVTVQIAPLSSNTVEIRHNKKHRFEQRKERRKHAENRRDRKKRWDHRDRRVRNLPMLRSQQDRGTSGPTKHPRVYRRY
ncbi:hypothetical protein [Phyllobacterium sp. SB3]|uniref:hypothetical protein n=1 Tax=Phyllobacterium sp. SB3 TaxID=3156073 RepID=UPI0032AFC79E